MAGEILSPTRFDPFSHVQYCTLLAPADLPQKAEIKIGDL
jgi:hypothetical protein